MDVHRLCLPLFAGVLTLTSCSADSVPIPRPTQTSATTTPAPSPSPSLGFPSPEDPLSPKPAVESPASLGQPTCLARALSVTDADAVITDTAVTEVFVIRVRGAACQLQGWPDPTLLDARGQRLPVTYHHNRETPAPLTLTEGTSLSFGLTTGRGGSCTDASTLSVILPGTTTALTTATALSVCGAVVTVSPVERLQDDEGAEH